MSALEPGLYRATVRGVADQIVMLTDAGDGWTMTEIEGATGHDPKDITDARPRIVLDTPEGVANLQHWSRLAAYLRRGGWDFTADLIESQAKPARIPEPGMWGVVEASSKHGGDGRRIYFHGNHLKWESTQTGTTYWDQLIDPVLIREGVA